MNAPTVSTDALIEEIEAALQGGVAWLERTQDGDGSWPGNYGGPLFLLPLYIATCRIIDEPIDDDTQAKMLAYLASVQNDDGGFGLHVEGPSSVYGSVANYVALRLLGAEPNTPQVRRARTWIHQNGGPTGAASWGKFFLALLDLYPYHALNPIPPELWLLPESFPVHPARLWCHCRMVYLPMSYLYRKRSTWQDKDFIGKLRAELYPQKWEEIDWEKARRTVHPADNTSPQKPLARFANRLMRGAERTLPAHVSDRALQFVLHQIDREDKNTNYICIGPINKLLNALVWHFEDPTGPELAAHRPRLKDYLYEAPLPAHSQRETGILMQGYNSSRLWDTAFAVQALVQAEEVAPSPSLIKNALLRAARFVDQNQVREDVFDKESAYRHASRGGWPFSDRPHGWPISDCTAEGIKASLALLASQEHGLLGQLGETQSYPLADSALQSRLEDALELILSMQNADGGWATYELTRGPEWLEQLNPSDCFRDIMIDYSYVECTSACMQAIRAFSDWRPQHRRHELESALERGRDFLLKKQRSDGSFEGAWGVCFTYGTWFGVKGLCAAGLPTHHPRLTAARRFLESKQRTDGGWGESVQNCETRSYNPVTDSQAVMTSWALLALMACGGAESVAVSRGVNFLLHRRKEDGTFPDENIAGVFNKTCAIHYDNYLKIFPVWALSEFVVRRRGN